MKIKQEWPEWVTIEGFEAMMIANGDKLKRSNWVYARRYTPTRGNHMVRLTPQEHREYLLRNINRNENNRNNRDNRDDRDERYNNNYRNNRDDRYNNNKDNMDVDED